MNRKALFFVTICNTILLLILTTFLFFRFAQDEDKIVYVDNIRLFNGFNMTKDLNRINGEKINKQKKKLDSLYTIYGIFKDNNQTDKLGALETQLRNQDQELKNMNERFSNEISQAVWNRLNSYIKDYGAANGYKIVLGTQGNGNVMFAQEGIDITEAVISYSNSLYEGEL
ncbi:OmpH family outer membrane protein [Pelagihabitans pacificus]|uniref:OmpH family outer membrane protein n=1 Tax=Pelagihabitans pacificus TaxID=2696054 RepID=UPI00126A7321|nr:OmpH family outer membrane protein [Pelagihabitans pacificus]